MELVADSRALPALEVALEAPLARLSVALEAPLARLSVALEAPLAALPVAEANADDKTPRAPVEMAVAEAEADWAMARDGQRGAERVDAREATYRRSSWCQRR